MKKFIVGSTTKPIGDQYYAHHLWFAKGKHNVSDKAKAWRFLTERGAERMSRILQFNILETPKRMIRPDNVSEDSWRQKMAKFVADTEVWIEEIDEPAWRLWW